VAKGGGSGHALGAVDIKALDYKAVDIKALDYRVPQAPYTYIVLGGHIYSSMRTHIAV
jgi:hypothetical protein